MPSLGNWTGGQNRNRPLLGTTTITWLALPNGSNRMRALGFWVLASCIPVSITVPTKKALLFFSDFLNIPPPAQPPPPDDSPIDRPLPPQRTLPPLPDEPLYEEAKPAPPPTMPRPSKQMMQMQAAKNGMCFVWVLREGYCRQGILMASFCIQVR